MIYRVTFRKRFDGDGNASDRPEMFVQPADGVILSAARSEVIEPAAMHSQEALDEDDSFESLGTESWEYEIADGRKQEFIDAMKNSRMVIEYEEIEEVI